MRLSTCAQRLISKGNLAEADYAYNGLEECETSWLSQQACNSTSRGVLFGSMFNQNESVHRATLVLVRDSNPVERSLDLREDVDQGLQAIMGTLRSDTHGDFSQTPLQLNASSRNTLDPSSVAVETADKLHNRASQFPHRHRQRPQTPIWDLHGRTRASVSKGRACETGDQTAV